MSVDALADVAHAVVRVEDAALVAGQRAACKRRVVRQRLGRAVWREVRASSRVTRHRSCTTPAPRASCSLLMGVLQVDARKPPRAVQPRHPVLRREHHDPSSWCRPSRGSVARCRADRRCTSPDCCPPGRRSSADRLLRQHLYGSRARGSSAGEHRATDWRGSGSQSTGSQISNT